MRECIGRDSTGKRPGAREEQKRRWYYGQRKEGIFSREYHLFGISATLKELYPGIIHERRISMKMRTIKQA